MYVYECMVYKYEASREEINSKTDRDSIICEDIRPPSARCN